MKNEVKVINQQVFENDVFGKVRTVTINEEPWFVGKDVAECLGYGKGKSLANAVANHVDDEDKGVTEMMTPGGKQEMTVINESGLYSLIMSSKLPSAKEFKRWVTSEVLPSIRKNGMFVTDKLLGDPEFAIKTFERLRDERNARIALEEHVKQEAPYTELGHAINESNGCISIKELAHILGQNGLHAKDGKPIGQNNLFLKLKSDGYMCKKDTWLPTQIGMRLGLFYVQETPFENGTFSGVSRKTLVTGKGQTFFVNKYITKAVLA